MENKKIYIIVAIVIAIIAIAGVCYFVLNSEPDYKTITINHMNFEVPNSTSQVNASEGGWAQYESSDISIYSFESTNTSLSDLLSFGLLFNAYKEVLQKGAQSEVVDGVTLNKTSSGNYSYYYMSNVTHQNILITAKDSKILAHAVKSMKM